MQHVMATSTLRQLTPCIAIAFFVVIVLLSACVVSPTFSMLPSRAEQRRQTTLPLRSPGILNSEASSFLSLEEAFMLGFMSTAKNLGGSPYLRMLSTKRRTAQMCIQALNACSRSLVCSMCNLGHELRRQGIETCRHHVGQAGTHTSPYAVPHHCSSWLRFPSTSFCRDPVCSCEACWPSLETSCSLTCSQQAAHHLAQRLLGRTLSVLGSAPSVADQAYAAALSLYAAGVHKLQL